MSDQRDNKAASLPDDELYYWTGYIQQPDTWQNKNAARRGAASIVAKKGRNTFRRFLVASIAGMLAWIVLSSAFGKAFSPVDFLIGAIIGILFALIMLIM